MAYSTGMMDKRVSILQRAADQDGSFGRNSKGRKYEQITTIWAAVDFNRGSKALREGAYDAYDRLIIRCRWNKWITRESMLVWDDRTFQIESFNSDKRANTIQLTVVEVPGKDGIILIGNYILQDVDDKTLRDSAGRTLTVHEL